MNIFIAHASENKDEIARPLAEALIGQGYDVWYDEFSLKLGDSLSQEIDKGLSSCEYGIVILSESFFNKNWPQRELSGLVARETSDPSGKKLILPIWHGVDAYYVRQYSPPLADRVAINTTEGIEKLLGEINRVTQFIDPEVTSHTSAYLEGKKNSREILKRIVPAGPIQPDGGYTPASIKTIEDFVEEWEEYGEISLLVKVDNKMTSAFRKTLFNEDKFVYLFRSHGMHKVWIEVIDLSHKTIGLVWTPPNQSDIDYNHAIDFFLSEMGFFETELFKVPVFPIINSVDSFWVKIG